MNITPLIETALQGIGCPVDPIKHKGNHNTYIAYYTLLEAGELYADGEEIAAGTRGNIDIFSKSSNYKALAKEVRKRLKQAGFSIISSGPEMWEEDTGYYHLPIEVYIFEGLEDDD